MKDNEYDHKAAYLVNTFPMHIALTNQTKVIATNDSTTHTNEVYFIFHKSYKSSSKHKGVKKILRIIFSFWLNSKSSHNRNKGNFCFPSEIIIIIRLASLLKHEKTYEKG